jgi:hypothetical protein
MQKRSPGNISFRHQAWISVPITASPRAAELPQAASAASPPTVGLIAMVAINYLARLDRNDVITRLVVEPSKRASFKSPEHCEPSAAIRPNCGEQALPLP